MKAGRIIAAIAAAALSVTLVACGNSSLSQELLDEASGVRIEAENATADNVASTEGAITVGENDLIVISPNLDKGSLHVTITSDDDGTVVYDEDGSGWDGVGCFVPVSWDGVGCFVPNKAGWDGVVAGTGSGALSQ